MNHYDVICVGSGLTGAPLAIGLAQAGLRVAVIDRDFIVSCDDHRTTSIAYGSHLLFEKMGLWNEMSPHACPMWRIKVFEGLSPWVLDYDAHDFHENPLGWIIENKHMRPLLQNQLMTQDGVDVFMPRMIEAVIYGDAHVTVTLKGDGTHESITLSAPLIVGADGGKSMMRENSTIRTTVKQYDQQAIIAHITHEKPHDYTAFEVFLPTGPFAILPLLDDDRGRHRSGIVLCKPYAFGREGVDEAALMAEMQHYFPYLGECQFITKRYQYPLSCLKVSSQVDHRLILVGDAAHVVHPIAGQGLNLGWRDVAALIDLLTESHQTGLDLGAQGQRFEKSRRFDRLSVTYVTDSIYHLYRRQSLPVRFLRNMAFATLNYMTPVKRSIMKRAMGL